MLMQWDWHPDVLDFINSKTVAGQIENANISVMISNDFMKAVKKELDEMFDSYKPIHPAIKPKEVKEETLESQKEELEASMDASDYGTMICREMEKIRKEGKIKENSVTDTHKVIYEAERRVKKMGKKDTEKYRKAGWR